jgi:NtrC-family two-component system sensor histidine kinase KinB
MSSTVTPVAREQKSPEHPLFRRRTMTVTWILTALAMGLLYITVHSGSPYQQLARYLCIVPVGFAAYRRGGLLPGLGMAAFFTSVFVWQLAWSLRSVLPSATVLELFASIVFLPLFAYVVASVAASLGAQKSLAAAVRYRQRLLAHASNLQEVVALIREEAQEITRAESAALMLLNPLDSAWELITSAERVPLPPMSVDATQPKNLLAWLLDRGEPLILDDLERDPRLMHPVTLPAHTPGSLLAQPLHENDGMMVAMLLLANREYGAFRRADLDGLSGVVVGAERALEQAGVYARTDRALSRRARQLGALQRAARELNATWDPRVIAAQTLGCALEITRADASLVTVATPDGETLFEAKGLDITQGHVKRAGVVADLLPFAVMSPPYELPAPPLLGGASSLMYAPIRRSGQTLGIVAAESRRPHSFEPQDLEAMAALADHAAIALENARLFTEVQRQRERANQIIETMTDGLITANRDGRIVTINPAAEALIGCGTEEVVGLTLCEVLDCADAESEGSCRFDAAIRANKIITLDRWPLRSRTGVHRILNLSAAPLPEDDGKGSGLVVLVRDITAREQMERFQRELVAAFSHELRAPLTNINTVIEVLLEGNGASMPDLPREHLETLRSQSRRLANFAERTLDVSRLDTGHWQLEPRPLPAELVIQEAAQEWQNGASERALRIEAPGQPLWIWADEHGVAMVLANLIDNAVKYSPAGSEIVLGVQDGPAGYATFFVRDQGPGIPPEHASRIFERFYRVDGSDAQQVYGHGLGLYISQRLVEAMGGEIWVTSEAGAGSRFAFALPVMQERHIEESDH